MGKKNCWEFNQCGRESGGRKSLEAGVCPASQERKLHAIHGGTNGGRACWVIAGTMCNGEMQGTFAQKFRNCMGCDFYNAVQEEEFPNFQLSAILKNRLM